MAFKRTESAFKPLADALRSMYIAEATFNVASTGSPGVNLKIKVNDIDESGQPQADAGKTFFTTFWLTENSMGMFCGLLDALGFKTDENGEYLLEDGSEFPDLTQTNEDGSFVHFQKGDAAPYFVGLPLVATTKYTVQESGAYAGRGQYNLNWVYEKREVHGEQKRMPKLSVHPRKVEAFVVTAPAPVMSGDGSDFGTF